MVYVLSYSLRRPMTRLDESIVQGVPGRLSIWCTILLFWLQLKPAVLLFSVKQLSFGSFSLIDFILYNPALHSFWLADIDWWWWCVQLMRQYEQSPVSYDADALEFQHARELKQRQKVKRRSSLKTYKASRLFAFLYCSRIQPRRAAL